MKGRTGKNTAVNRGSTLNGFVCGQKRTEVGERDPQMLTGNLQHAIVVNEKV